MHGQKNIKLTKFFQTVGILNSTFKPNLVHKCSRIKVYNHWLIPFHYVEAKFGSFENKDKNDLASVEMKRFRRTASAHFLFTKGIKKFLKA